MSAESVFTVGDDEEFQLNTQDEAFIVPAYPEHRSNTSGVLPQLSAPEQAAAAQESNVTVEDRERRGEGDTGESDAGTDKDRDEAQKRDIKTTASDGKKLL